MKKKALVFGLGTSGISACKFLVKRGFSVFAYDDSFSSASLRGELFEILRDDRIQLISRDEIYDFIERQSEDVSFLISSPGISQSHSLIQRAKKKQIEVFCDIELALRTFHDTNFTLFGITGTNGKTTTTLLLHHILKMANVSSNVAGNIGNPLLDEFQKTIDRSDVFVIELSSYQLETMKTKALSCACCLNITPNHLDHHGSWQAYLEAKLSVVNLVQNEGLIVLHESLRPHFSENQEQACRKVFYGFDKSSSIHIDAQDLLRFGKKEATIPERFSRFLKHDIENFLAAYAIARYLDIDPEICIKAMDSFVKPPHRIQYVRTVGDIAFYDDSKATSIEAVLMAVQSLEKKIVLIAGGVHKGEPYEKWATQFSGKVRGLVLIGEAATLIAKDFETHSPLGTYQVEFAKDLQEAVFLAKKMAKPFDAVLLSPGCSSFDMFKNFEERGRKFQEIVHSLEMV